MISILILFVLLFGFFMGLKRGFILQMMHIIGFIVSFIIAIIFYKKLAGHLALWIPYPELSDENVWAVFLNSMPVENAFYNAVAFALIFFVVKVICQIIASMLDFVGNLPILRHVNAWLGGVFGFLEVYVITFLLLFILALVPMEAIQLKIKGSFMAKLIIEHTPILSKMMESLWFTEAMSAII